MPVVQTGEQFSFQVGGFMTSRFLKNVPCVSTILDAIENMNLYTHNPINRLPRITINHLPPEVLSEIFILLTHQVTTQEGVLPHIPVFGGFQRNDPFVFGHVCRHWRDISIRTPSLWKSIAIDHPRPSHLHRTKLWTERIRRVLISINLSQSDEPREGEILITGLLLDMLHSHAEDWKNLKVFFRGTIYPTFLRSLADIRHSTHPHLDTVDINFHSSLHGQEWTLDLYQAWEHLCNIPTLRHLTWAAPYTPGGGFGQLQEVILKSRISVEDLIDKLFKATNLRRLDLSALGGDSGRISEHPEHINLPVELPFVSVPKLDCFTVRAYTDIVPLFRRLLLPSLKTLYIQGPAINDDCRSSFTDLLVRSKCNILEFGFKTSSLDEPQTLAWLNLDNLQSVETLVFMGIVTDRILLTLSRPSGVGGRRYCYFPNLKSLRLGTCVPDIDVGTLSRMIGSRFWTPVTCKPSIIGGHGLFPETDTQEIEVMVREITTYMEQYQATMNRNGRQLTFTLV